METTPNGRTYPSKGERKPNRKRQKRLNARIRNWETVADGVDEKNREGRPNGFMYRKPGSNNK